jgi:hypothetical protein
MHLPRQYCIMIGRQLWEFPRPYSWRAPDEDSDGWQVMGNYLYTCPVCGVQWARAWAADSPVPGWECITQPCEQHKLPTNICWATVPGSLFPGPWGIDGMRDPALFRHLPADLVAREFNLHLRRFTDNG